MHANTEKATKQKIGFAVLEGNNMSGNSECIQNPVIFGLFDRMVKTHVQSPGYVPNYEFGIFVNSISQIVSGSDYSTIKTMTTIPAFFTCEICGKIEASTAMNNLRGGYIIICDDCKKHYTRRCDVCHELTVYETPADIPGHPVFPPMKHVKLPNGKHGYACDNCISGKYMKCDQCGEYVNGEYVNTDISGSVYGIDDEIGHRRYICKNCYNDWKKDHTTCDQCGAPVHPSAIINGRCPRCHTAYELSRVQSATKAKKIEGYTKTPGRVFFSTVDTGGCYGVELEVQGGDESEGLLKALSEYQEVCLKRDGSVSRGFEIVSYPLSLGYHKQYAKWDKMFATLERYGYKSHDTTACGYHIHMSRLSFGDTQRKQSRNIAFMLYLGQKFQNQIKKFSRRTNYGYCEFYNSLDYENQTVTRAYQKAVNYNHHNRYMWLNFQNEHTVECRVFRGTLNYTTFLAAIELLDHMIRLCCTCKDETALRALTWDQIVRAIPAGSLSLKSYLKKKHLDGSA
jgi:hypothetical protein